MASPGMRWVLGCAWLLGACASSSMRAFFEEHGYRYPLHVERWRTSRHCVKGPDGEARCFASSLLDSFASRVAPEFARTHCPEAEAHRFWPNWLFQSEDGTFLQTHLECFGPGDAPPVRSHSCLPGETCACAPDTACFIVRQEDVHWRLSTQVSFRLDGKTWQFHAWGWPSSGSLIHTLR